MDKKKQVTKPDDLLEDESVISVKPKQDEAQDGSTKDSDPTMSNTSPDSVKSVQSATNTKENPKDKNTDDTVPNT